MATTKLLTDAEVEAKPSVKAVFADIRATRKSDFVNNFWRGLANDPALLKRTWEGLKAIMMVEGALDPLVREMIDIAVSTANGCAYRIHSHTAAARARGMTDAQHAELIAVIGLAGQTKSSRHGDANSANAATQFRRRNSRRLRAGSRRRRSLHSGSSTACACHVSALLK